MQTSDRTIDLKELDAYYDFINGNVEKVRFTPLKRMRIIVENPKSFLFLNKPMKLSGTAVTVIGQRMLITGGLLEK